MSELFTQNYSYKPLFHTDTDISESLHNQVDEASTARNCWTALKSKSSRYCRMTIM